MIQLLPILLSEQSEFPTNLGPIFIKLVGMQAGNQIAAGSLHESNSFIDRIAYFH